MRNRTKLGRNAAVALLVWLALGKLSFGQQFTQLQTSIPGLRYGSIAWGDFDNDGALDMLVCGDTGNGLVTRIYRNDGAGNFVDIQAGLPGVSGGAVAWGDYNGDGYLDFALTGTTSTGRVTRIYRNNGNSTFTDINANLPGLDSSRLAWGDYDNDGDLDLFVTGYTGSSYFARIYRNDGSDRFTDSGITNIVAGANGAVAWADFDNDGDQDLVFAGFTLDTSSGQSSRLYRNNNGSFTNITSISLTAMSGCSVAWEDYDNDGNLDLLMAGSSIAGVQSYPTLRLYHNNGTGLSFTSISSGMSGAQNCSVAWGDFDNDGYPDVVLAGYNPSFAPFGVVYRNLGNGAFGDVGAGIAGVIDASLAWGDFDNDGDLDLLVTGFNGSSPVTWVYRNETPFPNSIPSAPWGLNAAVTGKTVMFSWNPGSDANQFGGFSYNLRVGTAPGADDVMASQADAATGFRRLPALGNVSERLSWTLKLPVGTYYWSAQMIDHSFAGSEFAAEQTFSILPQIPDVATLTATNITLTNVMVRGVANPNGDTTLVYFEYGTNTGYGSTTLPQGIGSGASQVNFTETLTDLLPAMTYQYRAVASNSFGISYGTNQSFTTPLFTEMATITFLGVGGGSVAWGDFDNDSYLDLLIAGANSTGVVTRIYRNLGGTNFVDIQAGLPGINSGQVAWGDFDNDGRLDVLLTGNGISRIFHNDGGGVFTDINAGLPGLSTGASGAWADFNNDGNLDFAMAGAGGFPVKTYRNDGGGLFTDLTNSMPKLSDSSIAWADYDNDGAMDLLMTGYNYGAGGLGEMTRLYHNDGRGNFTNSNINFQGVSKGSVAWGDYNNDGYLDFLLTGSLSGSRYSIIYSNNGAGGFVAKTVSGVTKMDQSSVAWGDYNNDGSLDFAAAGMTSTGAVIKVYRNDGGTIFRDSGAALPGLSSPTLAWGDFDNDGRLDLLVSGYTGSNYVTRIYRNNSLITNTTPAPPASLATTVVSNSVMLAWGASSDINQAGGLTYNLRIGTAPSQSDALSPMADATTGFRRVPKLGNAGARRSWTLTNLVIGTYYWAVQAVDHNYAGSSFSTNGAFTITAALLPPVAITKGATNVGLANVTLQGAANPKGATTTSFFQYGTTTNFGYVTIPQMIGSGITNVPLNTTLSTLSDGTTYYFRLGASNINGTAFGATLSFTTGFQFSNIVTSLPSGLGVGNSYWAGCVAWGDYDNDGDLDLAVSGVGLPATYLFRNDGGGVFTLVNTNLPPAYYGTLEWGDYNRDGYLDLLIGGASGLTIARNNGNGLFTVLADISEGRFATEFATWVDYDNDGDLDICCYDYVDNNQSYAQARLYRNDNGTFVPSGIEMPKLTAGWMAWGDYDGDGLPDLAVTGQIIITNYIHDLTRIYHNDGDGNFTDINAPLMGLEHGRAAWCDVDNDGQLDLVVNGGTPWPPFTIVYHNDHGVFSDAGAGLPGAVGPMSLADFDNDGFPDVVLQFVGQYYTTNLLFHNNRNGTFTESGKAFLGQVSSIAWADYNIDGNLDVLVGSQLYRNNNVVTNVPPTPPTGLNASRSGNVVSLQWIPATDPNQSGGLTYNLQVGTSPGGFDVLSPESDANGRRRVAKPGIASRSTWRLVLPVGTYYWRVQAVDGALAGSPFSVESYFTVPIQAPRTLTLAASTNAAGYPVLNGTVNPNGAITTVWFEYGLTNFEFQTAPQALGSGIQVLSVAATTATLVPEATYSFRAVASNSFGKVAGTTLTFRLPYLNDRSAMLPAGYVHVLAWGDYDNDGALDLVVQDYYGVKLYHNDAGNFTNLVATFALLQGSAAWADYNNDGNLDLLVTGHDGNWQRQTKLYRNDGGGHFTEIPIPVTGLDSTAIAWADFDNDGRLDFLISGSDTFARAVIQMCRNEGNDVFTLMPTTFPPIAYAPVISCADYDNDGKIDILLAGLVQGTNICWLYHNDGNFAFSNSGQIFPGFQFGSATWGDYDNDGKLDLLLNGRDDTNHLCKVFHNLGGSFQELPLNLPGIAGSSTWFDYDNDGRLDILLRGNTNIVDANSYFTGLYRNLGSGSFANSLIQLPLASEISTGIWVADYDHDGDADLLTEDDHLFRNESNLLNPAPAPLTNLNATVVQNSVTLSWAAGTDANQVGGLSYNVRVGTSAGAGDIVNAMALANGQRLLPGLGNAFSRQNFQLAPLNVGTYYWTVQSIDHSGVGSAFAPTVSFVIPLQAPTIRPLPVSNLLVQSATLNAQVNPNGAAATAWFEYGLTTNYNVRTANQSLGGGTASVLASVTVSSLVQASLYHYHTVASNSFGLTSGPDQTFNSPQFTEFDIGLPLWPGSFAVGDFNNDSALDLLFMANPTVLFQNAGNLVFTNTGFPFTGIYWPSFDWGDYNNDGNLDLVLSGIDGSYNPTTSIFRNNGNGTFTQFSLGPVAGCARWGDYDNDGAVDLLISGGGFWQVWHNDGHDQFSLAASSVGVGGFAAWGDYNNDGYLDFVVTGVDTNLIGNPVARLIRNDGPAGFHDSGMVLPKLFGQAAWGDFDNDGHLDLLISGALTSYVQSPGETHLYHNNGDGSLTEVPTTLPNRNCNILLADYNNDGRLDVILSSPQNWPQFAGVFRNDGDARFTQIESGWPQVAGDSGLGCGDFDGDGDLDFLLSGDTPSNSYLVRLYRNNSSVSNSPPGAPAGLAARVSGNAATLSWLASLDPNQPAGLSYNLRIGTGPGAADILNPMADLVTGRRKVPRLGNAQENLRWTITNLAAGTYYWSVQAVDHSYAGSVFAPEMSFTFTNFPPTGLFSVSTPEDSSLILLAASLTNAAGQPLTFNILTAPSHGTMLTAADGQLWYRADTNFFGNDAFVFQASAGGSNLAPGIIIVTVTPVPDVTQVLLSIRSLGGGNLELKLTGEAYQYYEFQQSIDLVHWFGYAWAQAPPSGTLLLTNSGAGMGRSFFRARAVESIPPLLSAAALAPAGHFQFTIRNLTPGLSNVVQSSLDLINWSSLSTNLALRNSVTVTNLATDSRRFYRAFELR